MSELDWLAKLKNFLADRPEFAFLACALLAIIVLWRALRKAEEQKLDIAMRVIPLVDRLQTMLLRVAERRGADRAKVSPAVVTSGEGHDPTPST